MNIVMILIALICGGYGVYTLINVFQSEKVEGTLTGYNKRSHYDTGANMEVENSYAIYEFTHNGRLHEYESKISKIPFLKQETKTLYINQKDQVFEIENGFLFLLAGIVIVVINIILK